MAFKTQEEIKKEIKEKAAEKKAKRKEAIEKRDARNEKKRIEFEKKRIKSKIDEDRPRAKTDKENRKYPGLSKVVKAEKVRKNKNKNVKKKKEARKETVQQASKNLTKDEARMNRKYPGIIANQKADETYKSNTDLTEKSDAPKKPKKFDYKNKSKTNMSASKGRKNARGRSSSEIANDPSFMKNTSKGKYLRGIHSSLLKQGMANGGAVKKPSTKPSAGNKWN